jgi:hypothetical protein
MTHGAEHIIVCVAVSAANGVQASNSPISSAVRFSDITAHRAPEL